MTGLNGRHVNNTTHAQSDSASSLLCARLLQVTTSQDSHAFSDKNSRTFQHCQNVFPEPSPSLPTFSYKDITVFKYASAMLVLHAVYFKPAVNSSPIKDHHFFNIFQDLRL